MQDSTGYDEEIVMPNLRVLQIETTNLCNSHCVFCVHDKFKKFGTMSDALFEKILNDAKEIETLEFVIPMLTGEPFMDKKMVQRLKLINEILPGVQIQLYTNGSFLTPKIIKDLIPISNFFLFISLNGDNAETRRNLMGLNDYDHVVEMIHLYGTTGKLYKITFVAYPSILKNQTEEFIKTWKEKAFILRFGNFLGKKFKAFGTTGCGRAIDNMTVLWDGRVNLCCFDAFGEVIFGDLNKQTVKEIWYSKKRQSYAISHLAGKMISPCDRCFHKC